MQQVWITRTWVVCQACQITSLFKFHRTNPMDLQPIAIALQHRSVLSAMIVDQLLSAWIMVSCSFQLKKSLEQDRSKSHDTTDFYLQTKTDLNCLNWCSTKLCESLSLHPATYQSGSIIGNFGPSKRARARRRRVHRTQWASFPHRPQRVPGKIGYILFS